MSQTTIESYFANRKRPATDDLTGIRSKKVIILNSPTKTNNNVSSTKIYPLKINSQLEKEDINASAEKGVKFPQRNKLVTKLVFDSTTTNSKVAEKRTNLPKLKPKKVAKELPNQPSIQTALLNLQPKNPVSKSVQDVNEKTPPISPINNALDNIKSSAAKELSFKEIKNKLTRSSKLAELKASIARFNKHADKLKEIEKKTSPTIKTFKTIDIEIQISPKKVTSPVKSYLSPKKDTASTRRNLTELFNPTKGASSSTSPSKLPAYQRFQNLASPGKPSLTLPYKYRSLAEMFRSIDTICAMLFNRKETITFSKLKPAVEEMMRRNLGMHHLAQIKTVYPDAFSYSWDKLKNFALNQEKYEFVIVPNIIVEEGQEASMTPNFLLERKRVFFNTILEKVKDYHHEFLMTLDPPLEIPREKLTRWHPEFDIEKVPDIEVATLPEQPQEECLTTGKEVLEKARSLFKCNTRMEKALEKLKELQENKSSGPTTLPTAPSLKGIPQALLEKVRAKQAAKALEAMTRSADQDKESEMYSRLPEFARLLRNTFIAEKKGVLPLEEIILKLNNSYRSFLTNSEIEEHLRLLRDVVPGWIVFHEVRRSLFIKLSRDGDMGKVMKRLEDVANRKRGNFNNNS